MGIKDFGIGRKALAAAVGALTLLAAPSPAQAAPSDCRATGSKTLDSSDEVRLYRVGTRFHVCSYANGRRESLHRLTGGGSAFRALGDFAVAGRYVAFTRGVEGVDYRSESLYVRDVRKGRWLHRGVDPVAAEAGFEPADGVDVQDLEVDARGRTAYTLHYAFEPQGQLRTQVVGLGRGGAKALLDSDATGSATGIDPTSLAIAPRFDRSRVYWMHGDTARTATLN